ncbi:MAG: hypothetical protein HQK84_10390, partial [Nitrospinae bacterium]|nr:hypothetical protein [Nitrospinota bacterium]
DPKTGDIRFFALKKIVAKVKDPENEISKKDAEALLKDSNNTIVEEEEYDDDLYLDDDEVEDYDENEIEEEEEKKSEAEYAAVKLETKNLNFSRQIIQKAKNIIQDKVHNASRNAHFEYYNRRKGSVMTGTFSYETKNGDYIVNLGKLDGILLKSNRAVDEVFKKNERLKVFVKDVVLMDKRIRIELSRLESGLIMALFSEEVPEISDGLVIIKSAVRDRIGRVKILVESTDRNVDAVGSCVGVRGSRVKNVIAELKEERIDIVPNSDEIRSLALKALGSDEVDRVYIDVDKKVIEVVVLKDKLPRFIGKKGQNVRLASKLIKWHIDIYEVSEYEKKKEALEEQRQEEEKEIKAQEAAEKKKKAVKAKKAKEKVTEDTKKVTKKKVTKTKKAKEEAPIEEKKKPKKKAAKIKKEE